MRRSDMLPLMWITSCLAACASGDDIDTSRLEVSPRLYCGYEDDKGNNGTIDSRTFVTRSDDGFIIERNTDVLESGEIAHSYGFVYEMTHDATLTTYHEHYYVDGLLSRVTQESYDAESRMLDRTVFGPDGHVSS